MSFGVMAVSVLEDLVSGVRTTVWDFPSGVSTVMVVSFSVTIAISGNMRFIGIPLF
jgi:hypothetical protein